MNSAEERMNSRYVYVRNSDGARFQIKQYGFWTQLTNGDYVKFAFTDSTGEVYVSHSMGHSYNRIRLEKS